MSDRKLLQQFLLWYDGDQEPPDIATLLQNVRARLAEPDEEASSADAAIKTLQHLGYTYHGGELWKPPLGNKTPDDTEARVQRVMAAADGYAMYRRYSDQSMTARAELERTVREILV